MGKSTKKSPKTGQLSANQERLQGTVKPNTPPTGFTTTAQSASADMSASSIIQQSNDILYGNTRLNETQFVPQNVTFLPTTGNLAFSQSQSRSHSGENINNYVNNNNTGQGIQRPQCHPNETYNTHMNQPSSPTPQLTSILQSLDTRLGKIENTLGFQCQQMGHQDSRIQNIERHVEQITALKQTVSQMQTKVFDMDNDLSQVKSKHTNYEDSIRVYSDMCDDIIKSQVATNDRISKLNEKVDSLLHIELENIKLEQQNLKEDFLDSKTRQMCENLIFTGIPEVSLNPGEVENCELTLRSFLSEQMGIHDQSIQFDRVHRLGRYKRRNAYPRPIIAKFHSYKSKEMVKQKAPSALRNTNFGVREQYPDEYEKRRKVLYPTMKSAKQNSDNKVRMVRDTLYINNDMYKCGPNDTPILVQRPNQIQQQNRSQNRINNQQLGARPKQAYASNTMIYNQSRNTTPASQTTNFMPPNQPSQSINFRPPSQSTHQIDSSQSTNCYTPSQSTNCVPTIPPPRYNQCRQGFVGHPQSQNIPHTNTPAYNTERFQSGYTPSNRNSFSQNKLNNTENIETDNPFLILSENENTYGKYAIGKHQASSPIDEEQDSKKQRENDSDLEQSYMQLTPSPSVTISQINPSNASQSNTNSNNIANTQTVSDSQQTTSSSVNMNIPAISEVENHGQPAQIPLTDSQN